MTAGGAGALAAARGWMAGRSLRVRLTLGLLVLVAAVCAAVGVTTTVTLHGFLVSRLDQQLSEAGSLLPGSLQETSYPKPPQPPPDGNWPGTHFNAVPGQAVGTFAASLSGRTILQAEVVADRRGHAQLESVHLTAQDRAQLTSLPTATRFHTVHLSSIGDYRLTVVHWRNGEVLLSGLSLASVDTTTTHMELVEVIVFGLAMLLVGLVGMGWVRLALRPLRRVALTATRVTQLPLGSGAVTLPEPVPDADPATEVGQLGQAFNRMLGHVESALAARQRSEDRLRRFVADASHELRTPLAAIRAHAELARRHPEVLPEPVDHALGRVAAEAVRMGGMVEDLLLLASLDAGRRLNREPVDLTRLAIDATSDASVAGADHRWTLDLPDQAVTLIGDAHRLHQVVANLLANARTHTPPGTTVTTAVGADPAQPGWVTLTVADDGPGIAPALQPTLFERFVRGDSSRSRAAGSTGLGLAIVEAVVSAHGGRVDVVSRPGSTRFTVRLPAPGRLAP